MVKQSIELRNVQNVAASKTALIELPVGKRYHQIILQHGYSAGTNTVAGACTNIAEIRVKVNGRVQRVMSGTQLRDMNILNCDEQLAGGTARSSYDGNGVPNTAPGVALTIFFAEPWRESKSDQEALAWPTNGFDSFQIEVDFGAASTPTLSAWAVVDNFQAKGPVSIVKWLRQSFAASGTSFDISTLDRRDWVQQLSIYPDSGASNAITQVTLRLAGNVLHELTGSANQALLLGNRMTPLAASRTANIYDLVLDHDNLLGSAVLLEGQNDVTLTIAAGSAMSGTSTVIIQRLGPPE